MLWLRLHMVRRATRQGAIMKHTTVETPVLTRWGGDWYEGHGQGWVTDYFTDFFEIPYKSEIRLEFSTRERKDAVPIRIYNEAGFPEFTFEPMIRPNVYFTSSMDNFLERHFTFTSKPRRLYLRVILVEK